MRLQSEYDLKKASRDPKIMERVARIVPVRPSGLEGAPPQ